MRIMKNMTVYGNTYPNAAAANKIGFYGNQGNGMSCEFILLYLITIKVVSMFFFFLQALIE